MLDWCGYPFDMSGSRHPHLKNIRCILTTWNYLNSDIDVYMVHRALVTEQFRVI